MVSIDKSVHADEIWVSNVKTDPKGFLPNKQGLNVKFHGYDWAPMEHRIPIKPDDVYQNMSKAGKGVTLQKEELPEAACVFSESHFKRVHDFIWFHGFIGVTGRLAEVLNDTDLGTGGGLVPIPVFKQDLSALMEGNFYLINWGQHDLDSFNSKFSQNVKMYLKVEHLGIERWSAFGLSDGTIALNEAALDGPDLWIEPRLDNLIFMKGWVARAILDHKIKPDLSLSKCQIIENGGSNGE